MRSLVRRPALFVVFGALITCGTIAHGQIIADLRGDFVRGQKRGDTTQSEPHPQGLPDEGKTGFWNYYTANSATAKNWKLNLLTWDKTWRSDEIDSTPGYVSLHPMHIGSITGDKPAIHGEPAPPAGACAMHPSHSPGAVVAEWTSQTGGDIKVAGSIQMALDAKQSGVAFMVVKKTADGVISMLVDPMILNDVQLHPYQANTTIARGDHIYFVLGANGSPWSDHSHVTARIARLGPAKDEPEAKPTPKANPKEKCESCSSRRRLFGRRRG